MEPLLIFIIGAAFISWIDWKNSIIPDKYIIPLIFILGITKVITGSFETNDLIAVLIILIIFLIPIFLNFNFGGGDLRFGAFCALFLGLAPVGYFIASAGIIHLIIMGLLRKREFGFAPAMSIASLAVYGAVHA
ncbi:MAG: prepilin peptidase [Sulfuricurvum sp.]|nr:prepilin peptidase [Sulfuricurvum sp.]